MYNPVHVSLLVPLTLKEETFLEIAWKEHSGDPEAPDIARLLDLLETAHLEFTFRFSTIPQRTWIMAAFFSAS